MILYADFGTGAASGKILAALLDLAQKTGVYDFERLQATLHLIVPDASLVLDEVETQDGATALVVDIHEGASAATLAEPAAAPAAPAPAAVTSAEPAAALTASAPATHGHHAWSHIRSLLESTTALTRGARDRALATYGIIAQAEAAVHGTPVEDVHFHEVGGPTAICNVVGSCILLDALGVDEVHATPVALGFGKVRCAHGLLDIPAPATAKIIERLPQGSTFVGDVEGELTTPTGAALVAGNAVVDAAAISDAHAVVDAGEAPSAGVVVGRGAGRKRFPGMDNVMRVWTSTL